MLNMGSGYRRSAGRKPPPAIGKSGSTARASQPIDSMRWGTSRHTRSARGMERVHFCAAEGPAAVGHPVTHLEIRVVQRTGLTGPVVRRSAEISQPGAIEIAIVYSGGFSGRQILHRVFVVETAGRAARVPLSPAPQINHIAFFLSCSIRSYASSTRFPENGAGSADVRLALKSGRKSTP